LAVLGVVLWVLGGCTLGLYLRIRTSGYITEGRVLGTVSKPRVISSLGGAPEADTAHYLAVEFIDAMGQRKRGLLSEWQEAYARFSQGQVLALRVIAHPAYDDVYLARGRGAPKLALAFVLAGTLCLFRLWLSPWLWLAGVFVVALTCALAFWFLARLPAPLAVPAEKQFDDEEIQPMCRPTAG
jgi:hypothetical protein